MFGLDESATVNITEQQVDNLEGYVADLKASFELIERGWERVQQRLDELEEWLS